MHAKKTEVSEKEKLNRIWMSCKIEMNKMHGSELIVLASVCWKYSNMCIWLTTKVACLFLCNELYLDVLFFFKIDNWLNLNNFDSIYYLTRLRMFNFITVYCLYLKEYLCEYLHCWDQLDGKRKMYNFCCLPSNIARNFLPYWECREGIERGGGYRADLDVW